MRRRLIGMVLGLAVLASGASAAELQKVSAGYIPVADFAPAFIAKDKGYFEKHGLDVTLTKILLASNVPGALQSQSLDIGLGTPPMILVTAESGLEFQVVAGLSRLTKDNTFVSAIARPAANIKTAEDFKGKKVGVPGFNSSMDISFRKWLMDRGVDPHQVNFVEAIFPQMHDLLAGGTIDAAVVLEPFRSMIIGDGTGANVRDFFSDLSPDALAGFWMARADWIAAHREAVAGFRAALAEGIADLKANPDDFIAIQKKYLGFASPKEPTFALAVSKEDLAFFADISKQVGLLHQTPQLDKLIAP
jgi:NitT/TauT family transport system substrate-binding protein